MPARILYIGEPPWADIARQPCIKYGALRVALDMAHPWIADVVTRMAETLPHAAPLVDIRLWPNLTPGDIPGVPGWHYDVFNRPDVAVGEHRLYFFGAGCCTEFRDGFGVEGWVHAYGHDEEHRISPARTPGSRLLIRVSHTTIRPANRIYSDAHVVQAA